MLAVFAQRQAFGELQGPDACQGQEVTKRVLEVQQKLLQVARAQTSQQLQHLQEQLAMVNVSDQLSSADMTCNSL